MKSSTVWQDAAPANLSTGAIDNIDRVLASVRSYLGMDVAFLSEFLGTNRVFRSVDSARPNAPLKTGGIIPMAAGYCQHIVEGRLPELIPNTAAVPLARSIPETAKIPIGAHLSVPIRLDDGEIFGTFCCFNYHPMPKLERRDLELMRTFARLVAAQIEAELAPDRERVRKTEIIRAAVGRGDPQVALQPIYRLDDMTLVGCEALSRFGSEPRRPPDLWFADAEEVGLGPALELLAVRRAIAAFVALPGDLNLSLNISPATLIGTSVAESLTGIDPRRVVIEITEHVPIADYEALLNVLKPLRDTGMRVAIDDAGAGFSSLRHVLMLTPEIIKLDVSLTRSVDTDPTRRAMAAALSEFAHRTGTRVVAEGIETESELHALRELGIDRGQGYFLGKPMTPAQLLTLIEEPEAMMAAAS